MLAVHLSISHLEESCFPNFSSIVSLRHSRRPYRYYLPGREIISERPTTWSCNIPSTCACEHRTYRAMSDQHRYLGSSTFELSSLASAGCMRPCSTCISPELIPNFRIILFSYKNQRASILFFCVFRQWRELKSERAPGLLYSDYLQRTYLTFVRWNKKKLHGASE